MSQTYIGVIVSVLGAFLPKLGVTVGSNDLTTTVSVLVTLGGAFLALYRRYKAGGVTKLGIRNA